MLNQFHDVLPGTTISLVVDDALEIYARRTVQAQHLLNEALDLLIPGSIQVAGEAMEGSLLAVDSLRLPRSGFSDSIRQSDFTEQVPAVRLVTRAPSFSRAQKIQDAFVLEDSNLRLQLVDGRITSLVDLKADRELLLPGPGARTAGLAIYDDYPLLFDAWDLEVYHLDTVESISFQKVEVFEKDGVGALNCVASFNKSKIHAEARCLSP